jgi:hypothetical protein
MRFRMRLTVQSLLFYSVVSILEPRLSHAGDYLDQPRATPKYAQLSETPPATTQTPVESGPANKSESRDGSLEQGIPKPNDSFLPSHRLPTSGESQSTKQDSDPDLRIEEIQHTVDGDKIEGHLLKESLAGMASGKGQYSEIFPQLHSERRWAIDQEHRLNALIARLDQRLSQIKDQPSAPIQSIAAEEYESRRRQIESAIDENEKKQLQSPIETDRADAHFALIALTRSKGALGAAWLESRQYFMALELRERLKQADDLARAKLQRTEDYLLALDDSVNSALLTTDTNNSFRTNICLAFSGLVGAVIIGFFIVAYRDEPIRRNLFANDAAIQFVTIFCLIIAIILFGVINILEGRELAALLGGLSGYILGRGNLGGAAIIDRSGNRPENSAR